MANLPQVESYEIATFVGQCGRKFHMAQLNIALCHKSIRSVLGVSRRENNRPAVGE